MGSADSKGRQWVAESVPDLQGQVMVITGSNSGIGLEAAWILASRGAKVVMACRSVAKAEAAVEAATRAHPEAPRDAFDVVQLDLQDLDSVQRFAGALQSKYPKIDALICNAGIMAVPLQRTAQGHESQFGTNCLGHYALIEALLPLLEANAPKPARVIMVSSGAHSIVNRVDLAHLDAKQGYSPWRRYGETKLGNLLMVTHLAARLRAGASNVQVLGCHPGYSATNLQDGTAFQYTNRLFAQSGFLGSLPTVMAAVDPSLKTGDYIGPKNFGAWGLPIKDGRSKASFDEAHAKEFCDHMAQLLSSAPTSKL